MDLEIGLRFNEVCLSVKRCLFGERLGGTSRFVRGFLLQNFRRQSPVIGKSGGASAKLVNWQTMPDRFGQLDAETDNCFET